MMFKFRALLFVILLFPRIMKQFSARQPLYGLTHTWCGTTRPFIFCLTTIKSSELQWRPEFYTLAGGTIHVERESNGLLEVQVRLRVFVDNVHSNNDRLKFVPTCSEAFFLIFYSVLKLIAARY